MSPFSFLFTTSMIMGTLVAISSTNWIYLWMGMELNLLSFIPLIASHQSFQETEASVKYFIVQAVGSGLMLTSGIMAMNFNLNFYTTFIPGIIFMISMMLKLGMAPFHGWLPHVMSSISWSMCMTLATLQKIAPMSLMFMIMPQDFSLILMLIVAMGAIVGGLGGMNQTQMRSLMAYSSIGHMSWILATTFCSSNMFIFYFSSYIVISIALMTILMNENLMKSNHSNFMLPLNPMNFMLMMLVVLSLGGLPPLLGFFPKWLIISEMSFNMMTLTSAMIMGSLMNLFYYFNMTFNFIMSIKPDLSQKNAINPTSMMLCCLSSISPLALII
uniref:NADH-ubiquinone oxidoreductase chain 2 n=1 Tax=Platynereis bicanaliculata TaxID=868042 RepID=A0A7G8JTM9_9ANNE|nr:NADH dehydrogenase subunit 2 [Platynereis bicanaliculata]QNJ33927.1 NADH dehydrogenase subunit 2 [Platynereis bicanaliculata]